MIIPLLAASALHFDPWLSFKRAPSFDQPIAVDVGILMTANQTTAYWFKETVTTGGQRSFWWTDTDRCPLALSALREVRDLPMPRVDVPFLDNDEMLVSADGVLYELSGDAAYVGSSANEFKISSNVGSPLSTWVDKTLEILSPCWSKVKPGK